MADPADPLTTAHAFKRAQLLAAVERADDVPGIDRALALFTPSLPVVWELNLLLAGPDPGRDEIRALLAACETLQSAAGVAHRKLRFSGSVDRDSLAGLNDGWGLDRDVVMVHSGHRHGTATMPAAVVDLDRDSAIAAATGGWATDIEDPESARQLGSQHARWELGDAAVRRLGVLQDGRVLAWCWVFDDGRVSEIDGVVVAHDRRGSGLGRRLVEAAIAAVPPDRLLFLLADAEDWPRRLYERLGFETVGERLGLTRPPAP